VGRYSVDEVKEEIAIAGGALGLTIQTYGARDTADLEKVLTRLSKDRPDGLYMPGGVVRPAIKRVITFALKSRLPSMYAYPQAVVAGGGLSFSPAGGGQNKSPGPLLREQHHHTKPPAVA